MNERTCARVLVTGFLIVSVVLVSCDEQVDRSELVGTLGLGVEEGYLESSDGLKIFYRKVGSGPETAVYLHGGPWNMSDGAYELEALAAARTLISFDQRSGGRSELVNEPDRLTVDDFLQDIEDLRRYFQLDRMMLIGQSWGSGLATLYAARHPDRVDRLLLLSPMPPARNPYFAERVDRMNALIGKEGTARMAQLMLELSSAGDDDVRGICEEHFRLTFRAYLMDVSALDGMRVGYCEGLPEAIRHQYMAMGTAVASLGAWDLRPHLRELQIPVLVVEGEDTEFRWKQPRNGPATLAMGVSR
jgi:pimeloyl-ACP methyl ester carboxylesterase